MHEETTTTPAGRGSILDRTGVQLAIGEQDTTDLRRPAHGHRRARVALAAQHLLGADANKLYPQLLRKDTRFVYVARFADPKAANAFLAKHFTGIGSYPEERRAYPQNTVARAGDRLRRHRQQGARRARAPVRPQARRPPREADDHPRRDRAGDRHAQLHARAAGPEPLHDDRQPHPGERRGGAAPDRHAVPRAPPRARSCSIRARARSSRWRRRPVYDANNAARRSVRRRSATVPSPTRTSPGRRSSSSRSPARSHRDSSRRRPSSGCRTRSTSPTASSTTRSTARPRRSPPRRSSRTRRTSAP